MQGNMPLCDRSVEMNAPMRTITLDSLLHRSRPKAWNVSQSPFPWRPGDFVPSNLRFMILSWCNYFEHTLVAADDIRMGDYACSNDHDRLANHDSEMFARIRLSYVLIDNACAIGVARRVTKVSEVAKDLMKALNEHFGRNTMGHTISL